MNDTELALLQQHMEEMRTDIKELKSEVKNLLELWNTATGVLRVMKWTASIGSAIVLAIAAYKGMK